MSNSTCKLCGSVIEEGESKCKTCGNVVTDEIVIIKRKTKKTYSFKEMLKNFKIGFLIKNALLVVLSALMLIFAFFPLVKITVNLNDLIGEDLDITYNITPIKAITLSIDSLYNLDDDELYDSYLGEKLEKYQEKLLDDLNKIDDDEFDDFELSGYQKRLLKKIIYTGIRISYRSADVPSSGYMLVAMILSVIYLTVALGLFIVSVVNMLFILSGKKSLISSALHMLYSLIPIIIIDYFCIAPMAGIDSQLITTSISASAIIAIVLIAVFAIYLFAERCILAGNINISQVVKNVASLAVSGAVLCLMFAPVTVSKIKTDFRVKSFETEGMVKKGEAKINIPASYFAGLNLTEDELDEMDDSSNKETVYKSIFDQFSQYTRREVSKGDADQLNATFLSGILTVKYYSYVLPRFTFIYYLILALALFAGVVAVQSLICISTGKKQRFLTLGAKWLPLICALATLIFVIIHILMVNAAVNVIKVGYTEMIGFGPIALLICALALVCIPTKDERIKYVYTESENMIMTSYDIKPNDDITQTTDETENITATADETTSVGEITE